MQPVRHGRRKKSEHSWTRSLKDADLAIQTRGKTLSRGYKYCFQSKSKTATRLNLLTTCLVLVGLLQVVVLYIQLFRQ